MKKVCILGSTGSIGTQAIEVCNELDYKIVGIAAHSNVELLAKQAKSIKPEMVCIFDETKYNSLKQILINENIKIVTGLNGLCELAELKAADIVLNSVVGMVGLTPTLTAIKSKKTIALANKETMVAGGELVTKLAKHNNVKILPVDSEHSAIFQALQGNKLSQVKKLILTASGGPFYGKTKTELAGVTKKDALKHPNWSMGAKITIDSATLMNKGLELIEACWFFDKPPSEIEIVVHKQSVVHSLVEYKDNSVIAQLGVPDMKVPIQYALTYPDRLDCNVESLCLTDYATLTFSKPDYKTFVCLDTCIKAMQKGGLYPALVNGANEQAVELFLNDKISFLDIGNLVQKALLEIKLNDKYCLETILKTDKLAREFVLNSVY